MDAKDSTSTKPPLEVKPPDADAADSNSARARYTRGLEDTLAEVSRLEAIGAKLNLARGFMFFGGLLLLGVGYSAAEGMLALVVPGWLVMAVFLVMITYHEQLTESLKGHRRRRALYRQLLGRLDRNWSDLPVYALPEEAEWLNKDNRAVAQDLDLFGAGSLYQLVSLAATDPGKTTLARWLVSPSMRDEAEARNKAVVALAGFHQERERFYATARDVAGMSASPENFLQWAKDPAWLTGGRSTLLTIARVIAAAPLIIWPLCALGILPFGFAIIAQLILIGISLLITVGFLGPVHEIFKSVATRKAEVENYISLFETARWVPDDVEILEPLRRRLLGSEGDGDHTDSRRVDAVAGLKAMSSLSMMTCLRHSPILFIPYLVLQLLGLWDLHVLAVLERWKSRYGEHVEGWFDSLGQLEALLSLAALADEYPEWTSPTWVDLDGSSKLAAEDLGHPLLKDQDRVSNSVGVGPAGSLLLVTGSNMSGKSTLLRSLGLNIKLAGMGSVVCAKSLALPSCEVATSIRVQDSLKDGVSFYMAELQRLRDVVEHARRLKSQPDRVLFYLLDEILQGTNSRERHIAVATVLDHLVQMNAIGAISTHDLELADDEELTSIATIVHFREQITKGEDGKETMTFDYKMRDGVTPTTNAIRLLEMVGLGRVSDLKDA